MIIALNQYFKKSKVEDLTILNYITSKLNVQ